MSDKRTHLAHLDSKLFNRYTTVKLVLIHNRDRERSRQIGERGGMNRHGVTEREISRGTINKKRGREEERRRDTWVFPIQIEREKESYR